MIPIYSIGGLTEIQERQTKKKRSIYGPAKLFLHPILC